ncbi:NTP transferase domain-containing protein [Microbacterium sp. ZXX196]|uniref:phosphocholine cytidylyltransferase family protein n=1 Tax=Microbacterium sp. ZXX196 TaxID=2609291 RepID=UPI0012B7FF4E|nr:phosphocholine cytidylyltransferase family protein [Microbacterium sp. ZXX196]MTE22908.1 NTP transferase domain-containing protein [Microbacterium sp. ZXX196]
MSIQTVILAAGMGTRLGRELPKSLTPLSDGRTIMQQQHDNIRAAFGAAARITTVVGYRAETIIDAFPDAGYVHNERYDQTNTSKSLLRALTATGRGGVLWMNGDVVFDPRVLGRAIAHIEAEQSFVTVDTAQVSDEEVKYTLDAHGFVAELSKTVANGVGEAVGINYISRHDKRALIQHLQRVDDQDYFERGLELAIAESGVRVAAMDISDLYAVEVDFAEDLERANRVLS